MLEETRLKYTSLELMVNGSTNYILEELEETKTVELYVLKSLKKLENYNALHDLQIKNILEKLQNWEEYNRKTTEQLKISGEVEGATTPVKKVLTRLWPYFNDHEKHLVFFISGLVAAGAFGWLGRKGLTKDDGAFFINLLKKSEESEAVEEVEEGRAAMTGRDESYTFNEMVQLLVFVSFMFIMKSN